MSFDCFLEVAGIAGESHDENHSDWIEVLKYHHEITHQPGGPVGEASRCDHADFVITKVVDRASPLLAVACCRGSVISKVKMEICRATGDKAKYMEVILSDAMISRYEPDGEAQSDEGLPTEQVAFRYGKIEWQYLYTDHRSGRLLGNVQGYWNLESNTGR